MRVYCSRRFLWIIGFACGLRMKRPWIEHPVETPMVRRAIWTVHPVLNILSSSDLWLFKSFIKVNQWWIAITLIFHSRVNSYCFMARNFLYWLAFSQFTSIFQLFSGYLCYMFRFREIPRNSWDLLLLLFSTSSELVFSFFSITYYIVSF